jgi:large subunit ribosomal protein L9
MFGTITAKQIESELSNKHKITIDKRKFVNYEPINRIGESQVAIELDKNIIGTITVQVEEQ